MIKSKEDELSRWVDEYSEALLSRAVYLLSNDEDASDIVQEVFISAYSSYDSFEGKSNPLTWLNKILLNKISDFYRAKYRNPQSISLNHFFDESGSWIDKSVLNDWEYDLNEENLSQDNWETFLEDCLELLPDRWKILMKLYYLQEEKAANICQEIGITTTNLWKILQRSRLQMRECIEQKI